MKQFKYTTFTASGTQSGLVEATDQRQAIQTLRDRKVTIINITEVQSSELMEKINDKLSPLSKTEITTYFTRQLSSMITAGLSLTESLNILSEQSTNRKLKSIINDIVYNVQGGKGFADSLQKYEANFSRVYINLVRAGEASGLLDTILDRLAETLEKQREFASKTKGALIYPVVVMVALVIVMFIMMIFVIPRLTGMFKDMGVELPAPTKFLIATSEFFVANWALMILSMIIAAVAYVRFSKTDYGQRKLDTIAFHIPVFGKIRKGSVLTELSRTLSLLIGAGIPIIESLHIVSEASGSRLYMDSLEKAAHDIEHGYPLSDPIRKDPLYPAIFGQMVKVGEETGKLDEVLLKVSRYFESQVENLVRNLTTALEPFILIMLGLGVAFLVISIILPIYRLTTSF